MTRKLTQIEFVMRAKEVHGNKYEYKKSLYDGRRKKIILTCQIHGDFKQFATAHLDGQGCRKCFDIAVAERLRQEFVSKAEAIHGNKYDYASVEYKNKYAKVSIACPKHGKFAIAARRHLEGYGCKKCSTTRAGRPPLTQEEFLSRAMKFHGDKYNYDRAIYTGEFKQVIIECPIHGYFSQQAKDHMRGQGCNACSESKGERVVRSFLNKHKFDFIPEFKDHECRYRDKLLFDFAVFDGDGMWLVEFQGIHHYEPFGYGSSKDPVKQFKEQQQKDRKKRRYCKKHSIPLLEIPYWKINEVDVLLADFLGVTASE